MYDATHMDVFHDIAQLSEPDSSLWLRNAPFRFLIYIAYYTSSSRRLHYDVHSCGRFNQLLKFVQFTKILDNSTNEMTT